MEGPGVLRIPGARPRGPFPQARRLAVNTPSPTTAERFGAPAWGWVVLGRGRGRDVVEGVQRGGGGGKRGGPRPKSVCTKNGPTRFSRL